MLDEFGKNEITKFWKWIKEQNKDEILNLVSVEKHGVDFYLYIPFDKLESFAHEYIHDFDDILEEVELADKYIIVSLNEFFRGHGFTLDEFWKLAPKKYTNKGNE